MLVDCYGSVVLDIAVVLKVAARGGQRACSLNERGTRSDRERDRRDIRDGERRDVVRHGP